jgi:hypothetical protein
LPFGKTIQRRERVDVVLEARVEVGRIVGSQLARRSIAVALVGCDGFGAR